jgi:hypothetical protein
VPGIPIAVSQHLGFSEPHTVETYRSSHRPESQNLKVSVTISLMMGVVYVEVIVGVRMSTQPG